ncbi:MAG: replicative DNA helicase [Candidatus Bipolaricaulis sp.]|nr:replicative DNA helicase [Candidatus Bipolaricaulis sp.]
MKQPDVSATSSEGVRELPKNVEAEQQVLGAALLDPDGSVPILIERLTPEHFYLQRHRVLFRTIRELFSRGEPADIIAVANRLDERGDMERAGGRVYLNELLDRVATTASLEYHTDIVRRKAVLRSLIESGGQITELGYDEVSDPDEILDRAESMIFEISASSLDRSYFLVNDFLYEHIGSLEEIHRDPEHQTIRGFSTGFKELDDLTSGLQRSDLIIVAGRPGTGKTSLALSFVRQAAIRDKAAIACFSLEMTKEQLLERLLCGEAKVSLHRLRGGYVPAPKWRDIANAASKFQKSTIVIDDTPGASVLEIRAKARRIASQYGLDMIVVDYLQLVDAGVRTDVREQEIAYISRSMKKLARELNVPVVAVSQLSRAVERRESKRPVLSDLRESGALEQDADVVMFIYREDYYAQPSEAAETSGQGAGAEAEILVAKQRHGPPGTVKVHFNKAYASFYPMTWDEGGSAPF